MRSYRFEIRSFAICLIASMIMPTSFSNAADPSDYLSSRGQHRLFSVDSAPGTIGYGRNLGRGMTAGYFQPVAFSGPKGTEFTLSQAGAFGQAEPGLMAGLLVGRVYRFRVTGIPESEGAELYPSIEIIDRTYPPPGLETSYPIQVALDDEDMSAALAGQMVTKVVYLEDPQTAFAEQEKPTSGRTLDIAEYQDPLEVSDRFGRPVAIVRIGTLAPPSMASLAPQFFFGDPTWAPIFRQPQAEVVEAMPISE